MFTRSNPLLNRIPPPVRNLILALLIIGSLVFLPELRPVLALVLPIALPFGIGLVAALPVLLPPLRRLGQNSPAARRAEMVGFGALAYGLALVSGLLLFSVTDYLSNSTIVISQEAYPILAGLSILPALACAAFVAWFTANAPAASEAPE